MDSTQTNTMNPFEHDVASSPLRSNSLFVLRSLALATLAAAGILGALLEESCSSSGSLHWYFFGLSLGSLFCAFYQDWIPGQVVCTIAVSLIGLLADNLRDQDFLMSCARLNHC